MRVSIYARYSSDLQSAASIEDQIVVCTQRVVREGWALVDTFSDRGLSGASHLRPGYQALLEGARVGLGHEVDRELGVVGAPREEDQQPAPVALVGGGEAIGVEALAGHPCRSCRDGPML